MQFFQKVGPSGGLPDYRDLLNQGLLLGLVAALLGPSPLRADPIVLGDISYQPGDPITGLTDVVLDNFTDVADLGCSTPFPACGGLHFAGTLNVEFTVAGGSHNTPIDVGSTGPGSTAIYEFDPAQITFVSAVLTGIVLPTSFPLNDGNIFNAAGSFTSDTLTPDPGVALISISGTEISAIPEPSCMSLLVAWATAIIIGRRRSP